MNKMIDIQVLKTNANLASEMGMTLIPMVKESVEFLENEVSSIVFKKALQETENLMNLLQNCIGIIGGSTDEYVFDEDKEFKPHEEFELEGHLFAAFLSLAIKDLEDFDKRIKKVITDHKGESQND